MRFAPLAALAALCLAAAAFGADAQSLSGTYTTSYNKNKPAALSVELTPVDGKEGEWTAVFTAVRGGKELKYTGTATGDPAGTITGNAKDANGKRSWRFEAKVVDGVLTGEDWETTRGKDSRCGTFELKPQAAKTE